MSQKRFAVSVLGGDSAVARALAEVVEERELAIDLRRYTTYEQIDEGLEPYSEETIENADLVVIALEGPLALEIAERVLARNKPLLAIGTSLAEHPRADALWPFVVREAGRSLTPGRVGVLAPGLAGPVVASLHALAALEPKHVLITTYESSSIADQAGMDELQDQVRSIFTMKECEHRALPDQLAFSVIPSVSDEEGDPRDADRELEKLIAKGLGDAVTGVKVHVARAMVPTFSAEGAYVWMQLDAPKTQAEVEALLAEGAGLRWSAQGSPAAASLDRADALVGRVRTEDDWLSFWITADRLRHGSATAAALLIEQWIGETAE